MTNDIRAKIIAELKVAYWMEMETVMSYIANSTNLDGVRAEEIKKALAADVQAELGHAQILARRIKTIGGTVPGSKAFKAGQDALQPPEDTRTERRFLRHRQQPRRVQDLLPQRRPPLQPCRFRRELRRRNGRIQVPWLLLTAILRRQPARVRISFGH